MATAAGMKPFFYILFYPDSKEHLVRYKKEKPVTIEVARAHVRMKHKLADDSFGSNRAKDTMPFNNPPMDFGQAKLPFYLTEGLAWENDKVAFRQYFDLRNTKDIYGKTVPGMVMDTVGTNPKNSYHYCSTGAWISCM